MLLPFFCPNCGTKIEGVYISDPEFEYKDEIAYRCIMCKFEIPLGSIITYREELKLPTFEEMSNAILKAIEDLAESGYRADIVRMNPEMRHQLGEIEIVHCGRPSTIYDLEVQTIHCNSRWIQVVDSFKPFNRSAERWIFFGENRILMGKP